MEKQTVYVPEIVKSILGNGNLTGEFRPLDNRLVFTEDELKERELENKSLRASLAFEHSENVRLTQLLNSNQ